MSLIKKLKIGGLYMADLIKYHNDINSIPLRNLTEKEINLFFSIIYKAKNKGINQIEFDFLELRKLSNGDVHTKRFIKALDSMDKKLLQLNQSIEIRDGVFERFNLFNTFRIDTNSKKLEIEVHRNFSYMINELTTTFTKFELEQLVKLRSSYSKNAFRLMKQWESINKLDIKLVEFKRILCIPESYRMRDIDKQILTPIMEELSPIFPNLKLEKVKKGRSIDKLIFTWGKKGLPNSGKSLPPGGDTKVLEISEGLHKVIEKVKKNRFVKPLMTSKNIAHLVNKYSETELIEGLNFASTEINTEITSINYLIKTINTGIVKDEIKIVVKKTESKGLQGVEPKDEVKEELTEEIKEPKNEELKDLIKNTMVKGKEKLKGPKYYTFMGLLNSCKSSEEISDLILKYELN